MTASIWGGDPSADIVDADNTYKVQSFTATAGQTDFILTNFAYAPGTGSLFVFVVGINQELGLHYQEIDATTVRITSPLLAGTKVVIRGLVGSTGAASAAVSAAAAAASAASAVAAYNAILALGLPSLPLAIASGGSGATTAVGLFNAGKVKGADIVCAANINLDAATGDYVHITGATGPITSFTLAAGKQRTMVFDSNPTLTHNAASLIIPGGANFTVTAGTVVTVRAETANNVRITGVSKADGTALISSPAGWDLLSIVSTATAATMDIETTFSSTYEYYECIGAITNTAPNAGSEFKARLKIGGSYITTGTYGWRTIADASAAVSGAADDHISLAATVGSTANPTISRAEFDIKIGSPSSTTLNKGCWGDVVNFDATNSTSGQTRTKFTGQNSGTAAMTGLRLFLQTGNIAGTAYLFGIRKV